MTNVKSKIENRIEIQETEDSLSLLSKRSDRKEKILVGFALETDKAVVNAKKKLKAKDLDLIVVNDPSTFDSDSIKFSLIDRAGKVREYPRQRKEQAAKVILDRLLNVR